jgi:hypothetical protein
MAIFWIIDFETASVIGAVYTELDASVVGQAVRGATGLAQAQSAKQVFFWVFLLGEDIRPDSSHFINPLCLAV